MVYFNSQSTKPNFAEKTLNLKSKAANMMKYNKS